MRKIYGESKIEKCPFCSKRALVKNSQGISVCQDHKNSILGDMKCACGQHLELRTGKFGVYFNCIKCGNISWRKATEFNEIKDVSEKTPKRDFMRQKVEIVRSDDPRYFE